MKKALLAATITIVVGVFLALFSLREDESVSSDPECADPATVPTCLGEWGAANIQTLDLVLDTLTERTLQDERFADGCHPAWHIVGEAAGREYPIDVALADWAYGCAGGFMHGAVSTAVLRGTLDEFTADIVRVCENYKKRPEVVYLDCWHGAGHGYAQVLKYPESLYACIPVAPAAKEFEWCAWGATEELVEPFQNDPAVRAEYEPRLESLCTEITVGHAACFRAVAPMMYISGRTFLEIYDYCATLTTEQQLLCAFSAGHVLGMNWVAGFETPEACNRHTQLAEQCAAGAGRYVGRLAEWGVLDAELAEKTGIDGICPVFTEDLRPACQRASDEIRTVELSPSEERALTSAWWGSRQP